MFPTLRLPLLQLRIAAPLLSLRKSRRRAPTARAVGALILMLNLNFIVNLNVNVNININSSSNCDMNSKSNINVHVLIIQEVPVSPGFGARSSSIARQVCT